MTKEIYVIGFPKSGNTWLARLLGDSLQGLVAAGDGHKALSDWRYGKSEYVIRQRHLQEQPPPGARSVLIIRDPRDVIVSAAHYWQMSLRDYFHHMEGGIENRKPPNVLHGWPEFYRKWIGKKALYEADYFIKYEDLLNNTEDELRKMLVSLGVKFTMGGRICRVVQRNTFARMKKTIENAPDSTYSYGKEVQLRSLRSGTAGDWRNHLARWMCKVVHENMWYWLKLLDYENSLDWWVSIEEKFYA